MKFPIDIREPSSEEKEEFDEELRREFLLTLAKRLVSGEHEDEEEGDE